MQVLEIARQALQEDGWGEVDVTTRCLESYLQSTRTSQQFSDALATQVFVLKAKEEGVFSGTAWIEAIATLTSLSIWACVAEGERFFPGQVVCRGQGAVEMILRAERVLLNTLQHLCGVATQTFACVQKVNARAASLAMVAPGVFHTRKTLPLYRELQVNAVLAGGGRRHRTSLAERILFKENHKYFVRSEFEKFLSFTLAKPEAANALIEVETPEEAILATRLGVKALLLDNFSPDTLRETLPRLSPSVEIEVSGGLNFNNIADYVLPGVSRLSLGALTHSVRNLDLSLDWEEVGA